MTFSNENIIKNKYFIKDEICYIWINGISDFILIDIDDLYMFYGKSIYTLTMKNKSIYGCFDIIYEDGSKQHLLISRYIMQNNGYNIDNMIVDHINHNTLDNRKCNLRVCNKSQNNFNGRIARNNTSGVKGVYKGKREGTWRACIWYYNKLFCLGTFESFNDAVMARKNAEAKLFGEYNYSIESDMILSNQAESNNLIRPFYFIN